jgi:NAD(P)-dependent dehydrogenase (short-subunit alcohol dehydrogenase family)
MATQGARKVVVITGASAGIGRATARRFAAEGARIGLIARGLEGLGATRIEVEALGGEALLLPADVANPDELNEAARLVVSAWGGIDVWVNNASVSVFSPTKRMTAGDYARVTQVSYLGAVYGTLAALANMLPRDSGVIVQVSSALAHRGVPLQSANAAAKHALLGFTESLRTELLHDGSHVFVTMVDLPATNTPQFDWLKNRMPRQPRPAPPIYQPELAANAIYHAAHHPRPRGLTDMLLARTGYRAQQLEEPADPRRPSNLWAPVRGDHGAHGRFDRDARRRSVQLWAAMHRGAVSLGVTALLAASWLGFRWLRG